jgi:MFS family permease
MAQNPGFPRWMGCYVLLGLVQSGLLPIILPLAAAPGPTAGLTYGAFAAAGIAAPFIGAWSDRHRRHRWTLTGGLAVAVTGLLLHRLPGGVVQHMVTAATIGLGVSSANTVSTMFIVEAEPRERWDGRIAALQACIAGGQLVGLLLAGVLGLRHVAASFMLGAVLLALAVPLALLTAPDPVETVSRHDLKPRPVRGGDAAMTGPSRSLHRPSRKALQSLGHNGLTWFLGAWILSYTATNGLSVMISVATVRGYGAPATLPTTAYAIGVGLSLLIYRVVSRWETKSGPWRILTTGLALRAVLVAAMTLLVGTQGGAAVIPILACFGATQIVWPLLSVASNALAVTLSPAHRAETVGMLNAMTSLGATVGGIAGGVLLRQSFFALCLAVLGALLGALLLAWHPRIRLEAPEAAEA